MMKNIITLNPKSSMIIFLFMMFSCSTYHDSSQVIEKMYYYVHFDGLGNDDICAYSAQQITDDNGKRIINRYKYNTNSKGIHVNTHYYRIKPDGLFSCYGALDTICSCLFTTQKDTCIIWKFPDEDLNSIAQQTHCFMEKQVVKYQGTKMPIYKFFVCIGAGDSFDNLVQYNAYYDKSYILVKYEDISIGYPRIERIDSIPTEFKILLDSVMNATEKY